MKNKLDVVIATWLGSGLIPPPKFMSGMAGTYGSFFSLPLCFLTVWLCRPGQWFPYTLMAWTIYGLGYLTVPRAELALGPRTDWKGKTKFQDQNQIVIDETFGMLVACFPLIFITFDSYLVPLSLAFGLFRFFDIVKVPPTRYFDRMKNATGVMMDDGVAGVYAAICLTLIMLGLYNVLAVIVAVSLVAWLEEYNKRKKLKKLNHI